MLNVQQFVKLGKQLEKTLTSGLESTEKTWTYFLCHCEQKRDNRKMGLEQHGLSSFSSFVVLIFNLHDDWNKECTHTHKYYNEARDQKPDLYTKDIRYRSSNRQSQWIH